MKRGKRATMPKKLSKFSFYSYNSRSTFRIQVQAKIELNKQMRNVSEITTKGAAAKITMAKQRKMQRKKQAQSVGTGRQEGKAGRGRAPQQARTIHTRCAR